MTNNRYSLLPSNRVPNAGRFPIKTGLPIQADMINDICICCNGSFDFIPCNANILRLALLKNPELTKALLGLEVKDIRAKTKTKQKNEPKSKEETE